MMSAVSIKIDMKQARRVLEDAIVRAQGAGQPSAEWVARVRQVRSAPSKTYTPALGTALLARATNDQIDPLALKVTDHPRSYSARTLAEKILVPTAVEVGIDLVTTSRQPLNNQPFFRYDRIDEMPRVHG
jgi:SacI restriction endonuclease